MPSEIILQPGESVTITAAEAEVPELEAPVASAVRETDGTVRLSWGGAPDADSFTVDREATEIAALAAGVVSYHDQDAPDSALSYVVSAVYGNQKLGDEVTVPAHVEPEPGDGPSGIPVPPVKAGWKRVGFSHFDDDIPAGNWTGDKQGAMLTRPNGWVDTSKRGKYSNKRMSQHDSLLDCPMWMEGGQRYMSCPMNKAPNPSNNSATAPKSLRVTECMKVDGPEAGWKIAHMVAKYGAVRLQEIDWPEVNFKVGATPSAWLHLLDGGGGKHFTTDESLYGWHTYTIEFISGKSVQVEFDGEVIGRAVGANLIGTDSVHWIVQNETAIGGTLPPNMGEAHVLIDWVTIEVPV